MSLKRREEKPLGALEEESTLNALRALSDQQEELFETLNSWAHRPYPSLLPVIQDKINCCTDAYFDAAFSFIGRDDMDTRERANAAVGLLTVADEEQVKSCVNIYRPALVNTARLDQKQKAEELEEKLESGEPLMEIVQELANTYNQNLISHTDTLMAKVKTTPKAKAFKAIELVKPNQRDVAVGSLAFVAGSILVATAFRRP